MGGELELQEVRMTWERSPKYLEGFLAADTEKGTAVLQAPRLMLPRPMRIEVDTTAGLASIDVDMQATAPPEGWDHALVGKCGGTTIRITLRHHGDHGEMNMDWAWRMAASRSAETHLIGVRLLEAAAGRGELRVIEPVSGEVLAKGPSPQTTFDQTMVILKQLFEDVLVLEAWTGERVELPQEISGVDAEAVRRVARLIEGVKETWTSMDFTLDDDPGEDVLTSGALLQARRTLAVELFGNRYELGEEATYVADFKIVSSKAVNGGRAYVLKPATASAKTRTQLERSHVSSAPE